MKRAAWLARRAAIATAWSASRAPLQTQPTQVKHRESVSEGIEPSGILSSGTESTAIMRRLLRVSTAATHTNQTERQPKK